MAPSVRAHLPKIEWQHVLFADRLRRADLLNLPSAPGPNPVRINIHRNHAFEPVAAHLKAFLEYAGWDPAFVYGDYDDSLGLQNHVPADLEIIWLDFNRYSTSAPELLAWLETRLRALRGRNPSSPILVADWDLAATGRTAFNSDLRSISRSLPGVRICGQSEIAARLGRNYWNLNMAPLVGTRLSGAACLETARFWGCRWIPPALAPRIKAIVVDLDNTLYEGVLGEDGPESLVLKPEHLQLQQTLQQLRTGGIFLGVASRNDPSDVERLFHQRPDFPLRLPDFSAVSIGWHPKSDGIREVAAELRVGLDAVLFVDDNPGELAHVAADLPGIRLIYAADPSEVIRALAWFPGLHGYEKTEADSVRLDDLAAAQLRARRMAENANPEDYIRNLEIEIELALNPLPEAGRLQELSNKTNQFNTGLLRLSQADVHNRLADPDHAAVSIRLKDRLSDSGIVGSVFARRQGEAILIEEIAISCRALGRQVEDVMITEAIRGIAGAWSRTGTPLSSVEFAFTEGPRNQPARTWLSRYTGLSPEPGTRPALQLDTCLAHRGMPVSIRWKNDNTES